MQESGMEEQKLTYEEQRECLKESIRTVKSPRARRKLHAMVADEDVKVGYKSPLLERTKTRGHYARGKARRGMVHKR